ncbi:cytochrome c3 family protein [Bacillus sp. T33-2]|uniref:cytochrome c3 family protein n=1 Tax=Bacillus sp. T33-2 TaxID=2054168 RepID=UPI000C763207|nr:NapC/NirT family cytochrome c [Bacillus sp. T33-2]PLR91920.1 cytochrome C [Bacillus sp. T33-2]
MEEHIDDKKTPPRFRFFHKNWSKIAALTLLFVAILFSVGYIGLEGSSSSKFCASCHEMKPEFYTWKASSHSEVDCVNCHVEPGAKNLAKGKVDTIEQAIKKQMKTYEAPIRMPSEIPDEACERCHNINTRSFTPSGDLIIPHDKHKAEGVSCIQCHSGVAHGKIADRKMTYQADYAKWDDQVGHAAMKDDKYIKPDMDTCMECHKARKITTECKACHTTGMFPESHKEPSFNMKTHGSQAAKELKDCNMCHKDMSMEEINGFEELPSVTQFLHNVKDTEAKITQFDYAKQNTYCKACHSIRPPSHGSRFLSEHGDLASKNKQKCLACHNYQQSDKIETSMVSCASCHPSMHKNNKSWRKKHPVPVEADQKVTQFCYTCHSEPACSSCHKP